MLHTNRVSGEMSQFQVIETVPVEVSLKENPSFSIIIPVYNEAGIASKNLAILETFLERESYELIVFDDCSIDDTYNELQNYVKQAKNSMLLMHSNAWIGKGETMKRAIEAASGEIVVFMDVDLSTNLKYIHELIRQVRQSEGLVIGQRSIVDRCTQGGLRVI